MPAVFGHPYVRPRFLPGKGSFKWKMLLLIVGSTVAKPQRCFAFPKRHFGIGTMLATGHGRSVSFAAELRGFATASLT